MTTIVLLDLEETVIDDWTNMNFLPENIEKIRLFLSNEWMPDPVDFLDLRLGLMSWAVWNDKDRNTFINVLKDPLEKILGKRFDPELVLSMDDWCNLLWTKAGLHIERKELFELFSKEDVLVRLRKHFSGSFIKLFDDAVEHDTFLDFPVHDCKIQLINIKEFDIRKWNHPGGLNMKQ